MSHFLKSRTANQEGKEKNPEKKDSPCPKERFKDNIEGRL